MSGHAAVQAAPLVMLGNTSVPVCVDDACVIPADAESERSTGRV
jgi:hypothetical protein